MVLKLKPTNQGLRFILGISIIAVSIYLFYISLAIKNSPELFIVPEIKTVQKSPCISTTIEDYSVCLPEDMNLSYETDRIEILSARKKIRGNIEFMKTLPRESQWRESLKNPLIQLFIKDMDEMDTFELMLSILEYRYNPSIMGAKAKIIPPWMKNAPNSAIIIPKGMDSLVFYTPSQVMGLVFSGKGIVMISLEGTLDEALALSIVGSVKPI